MKLTKFGHCCMLIEESGMRVLTDPGLFTIGAHETLRNIDIVLFTHEHQDHYHLESLKKILTNNPGAVVLCNPSVGALLDREAVVHTVVGDRGIYERGELHIEGHGSDHAPIHTSIPLPQNTGYFVGERFWYPGDALCDPKRPVEILALPVAGPWLLLGSAIDYAIALKPRITFPIHDMLLSEIGLSVHYRVAGNPIAESHIEWKPLEIGKETEL